MKLLKNRYIVFPVLVGLILPTAVFLYYFSSKKKLDLPDAVYFSDKPLPASVLIDTKTSNDFYEQLKQGKVVAIFLTTSCNACKKDVRFISENYSELNTDAKVYGIAVEDESVVRKYIEEQNVKFPVLIDKKGQLLKELGIKYFPTKFLIENGIITKTIIGSAPDKNKLFQDFNLGGIPQ